MGTLLASGMPRSARVAARPSITGIDSSLALQYLGGRVDILVRVLRQFHQHYEEALDEVQALLTGPDLSRAHEVAHSIRGAAASVGAQTLMRQAGEVERLRVAQGSDAELRGPCLALATGLAETVRAIGEHLQSEIDLGAEPPQGAADLPKAALDDLDKLLAVGDYEAMVRYRELAEGLRQVAGADASELGTQLRRFDFARALEALRALRTRYSL